MRILSRNLVNTPTIRYFYVTADKENGIEKRGKIIIVCVQRRNNKREEKCIRMGVEARRPFYKILYGQSYLLNLGIKLKFLEEFESLFIVKDEKRIHYLPDYKVQTECIMDISEKIGFLYLALDYIKGCEHEHNSRLTKYHFYTFVFNCKACLDSMAVLLNHQLKLGFKGGKRDFRNGQFRQAIETKSTFLRDFSNRFGSWCEGIINYRDRIIHQIGVPVFITGPGPPEKLGAFSYCVPKKPKSQIDIVKRTKKLDHVEILPFCRNSIKRIMEIAEITFSEVHENITKA